MTAASVLGVPITPARAAACRELLAGVASRAAWSELAPLVVASEGFAWGFHPEEGPAFGSIYVVEAPTLHALASCALGSPCARCSSPIEDGGKPLDEGWCCAACVEAERARRAFRGRAALWLRRANQLGLFGEPMRAKARRKGRA